MQFPLIFIMLTLGTLMLGAACGKPGAKPEDNAAAPPLHPYLVNPPADKNHDLVIHGARVMDPESGLDAIADIGIVGDEIATLSIADLSGAESIDARGFVAAPGFIDIDTISYPRPDSFRTIEYWKLLDGVTTITWLHDGAPSVEYIEKMILKNNHLINWGYGLRVVALYDQSKNLAARVAILDAQLGRGALGIGMSPEYAPFMTTEDMVAYATVAAKWKVPVVIHTRYAFKDTEIEGIEEAIAIAERSGAHVHILHIHSTGGTWHMAQALALIDDARARGARIDGCVYPYSYWMTPISNPNRFKEGWREGLGLDYGDLYYLPLKKKLTRELFDTYRWKGGLIMVPEGTISWENSILPALAKDYIFFGSDGSCDIRPVNADTFFTHPRDSGTFATALSLSRSRGIPLMSLLRKMTIDPARFLESADPDFTRRGRIKTGAHADITIFDPATVNGGGTLEKTIAPSIGIQAVIVNGKVAYRNGVVSGLSSGTFIKGVRNKP